MLLGRKPPIREPLLNAEITGQDGILTAVYRGKTYWLYGDTGRLSYALRWHGDRPALLWQCERPGVTLTVPGLDPSFSTAEQSGEALLAPYRARIPIPLQDAGTA